MSSSLSQMLPTSTVNVPALAFIFTIAYTVYVRYVHNKLCRYLPGPPPLPFFGNILQLPMEYQERRMVEWGKTFGGSTFCDRLCPPRLTRHIDQVVSFTHDFSLPILS